MIGKVITDIPRGVGMKAEIEQNGLKCRIYRQQPTIYYVKIVEGYFIRGRYKVHDVKSYAKYEEIAEFAIDFHNKQN